MPKLIGEFDGELMVNLLGHCLHVCSVMSDSL